MHPYAFSYVYLQYGPMAERLGSALQKLLQRFESASDLQKKEEGPVNSRVIGVFLFKVHPNLNTSC